MTDDERDDLLERAGELNEKLEEVPFDQVLRQYNRQRSLLKLLLALVVALFLVVAVLVVVTAQVRRNSHDIATQHDVFVANCEFGNAFRVGLHDLFEPILAAAPDVPRTPAQQAQFDQFKTGADKLFAPRDCTAPQP